jgi:hypothetical protein
MAVYPQPVTGQGSRILLGAPFAGVATLRLYDLRGEQVWEFKKDCPFMGYFEVFWDASNQAGKKVSFGVYYLTAELDSGSRNRKAGKWISVVR